MNVLYILYNTESNIIEREEYVDIDAIFMSDILDLIDNPTKNLAYDTFRGSGGLEISGGNKSRYVIDLNRYESLSFPLIDNRVKEFIAKQRDKEIDKLLNEK